MAPEATDTQAPDVYLMTPEQVAEEWGISQQTLAQWRSQNRGPKFIRVGRSVRYHATDLADYIDRQRRQGTR